MHETSLMKGLIKQVTEVAMANGGGQVHRVRVRLGALSNITPGHFREHFEWETVGTLLSRAALEIEASSDVTAADASDVVVTSVEVDA
jgi:hydrogenase nickel incorporation protein HypA/HybF